MDYVKLKANMPMNKIQVKIVETMNYFAKIFVVLLLFTLSSACLNFEGSPQICYPNGKTSNWNLFATKTRYQDALRNIPWATKNYKVPSKCSPLMIYYFGRHAIRYPDADEIEDFGSILPNVRDQILKNVKSGKVKLCPKTVEQLKVWKLQMKPADDNNVTKSGVEEIQNIAESLMKKFPNLLDISRKKVEVCNTDKIRTRQTSEAFMNKIGELSETSNIPPSKEKEILSFHRQCKKLLRKRGVKLDSPEVVKKFNESTFVNTIRKRFVLRLALNPSDYPPELFILVHTICKFEYAILGSSPWCQLFTNDELQIIEYMDDLEDYYEDAYGRDINGEMGCPIVKDLLYKTKTAIRSDSRNRRWGRRKRYGGIKNSNPSAYLYFSHAGAIKRLMSTFGLFDGLASGHRSDLENYCGSSSRPWRSSFISPFSANIVFVLYRCKSEYRLMSLVQESPVRIYGCSDTLCKYKEFYKKYKKKIKGCDLDQICRI